MKEGDKFIVVSNTEPEHCYKIGDVVEFTGSYGPHGSPDFRLVSYDGFSQYISRKDVVPYVEIKL